MRQSDNGDPSRRRAILRISITDMIGLRVRTKDAGKTPPEFLYQSLPERGMSLLASIPLGTATISIPQQHGCYPISRSLPAPGNGLVITYARRENGRYEAAAVLHGTESYAIDEFHSKACRWVEEHAGNLQTLPGRFVYCSPSIEEWGVILRDGGFAVYDPSFMRFDLTAEIIQGRCMPGASGVIMRLPACPETLSGTGDSLPAFTPVELTMDPQPDPAGAWMSFAECQRLRALQSRPPEKIIRPLKEWIQTLTNEAGLKSWTFCKGMFFGDHAEWWGEGNRRRTMHEGIDFTQGQLQDGSRRSIPEGTPVRSIAPGELITVLDDFLNKTLVVRHPDIRDEADNVLHTLLSHIQPVETLAPGPVARGQLLGHVLRSKNVGAPPHLHLSGAWIPESISANSITMDMINAAFMPIVLINFNCLLDAGK